MKVVCSYCGKDLGDKEPLEDSRVSHGMCRECSDHFSRQWDGLSLSEYLDTFDFPVLILDKDGRVAAANEPVARMLGKERQEIRGLLGGEAMECRFARLEGGCGQTVHCQTCAVRNTVTETWETGESVYGRLCYVEHDSGKRFYRITAVKLERSVQLSIEPDPGSSIRS